MDEEIKKLLFKNLELSKETLEQVKKIRRRFFWQNILKTAKWAIIIVLVLLGFQQIQPYLNDLWSLYQNLGGTLNQIQGVQKNIPEDLQKFLTR